MVDIPSYRIAELTGINTSREEVNFVCPQCGSTGRTKKLYYSQRKGQFFCQKCGIKGGFIQFVALMCLGVSPDVAEKGSQAYDEAKRLIYGDTTNWTPQKRQPVRQIQFKEETPLADDNTLDETYRAFLKRLSLNDKHRDNLRKRGLSDVEIEEYGFKSVPMIGAKNIVQALRMEDACTLTGVPGFFKYGTVWSLARIPSGILIPIYKFGKIVGLQVRDDSPDANPRYKWVSSKGRTEGTPAAARTGIYGYASSVATIIEGPMKAFIAHKLGNIDTVIAIPGVNSTSRLDEVLEPSKKLGLQHIRIAFDMDYKTNENVKRALEKLKTKLAESGLSYEVLDWDDQYKGIDDYLLSQKTN
jgi:DNA primase